MRGKVPVRDELVMRLGEAEEGLEEDGALHLWFVRFRGGVFLK